MNYSHHGSIGLYAAVLLHQQLIEKFTKKRSSTHSWIGPARYKHSEYLFATTEQY